MHLSDAKHGYRFDFPIPCTQTDYVWSGAVYPGTYVVTVDGGDGYSNLPYTAYVANPALAVTNNVSGQALDVQTFTVGGTVTLNGAAPTPSQYCTSNPTRHAGHDARSPTPTRGYCVQLQRPLQLDDAGVDRHRLPRQPTRSR